MHFIFLQEIKKKRPFFKKKFGFFTKCILFFIGSFFIGACNPEMPEPIMKEPPFVQPWYNDGMLVVSQSNTVLNRYASLAQDATNGSKELILTPIELKELQPLKEKDLLLVIQMQGAQVNLMNVASYGQITNIQGAGLYEFCRIESIDTVSGKITISQPLKNPYLVSGNTQIVRVPQYTTLTVSPLGAVTALPWNGKKGGIVALVAAQTVLQGSIQAMGVGFRGGALDVANTSAGSKVSSYVSTNPVDGAEKGESIAGDAFSYDPPMGTGRYGRGAIANGGGGGNSYKSGGGGGANILPPGFMNPWTGQGFMDTSLTGGLLAWPEDPEYPANSPGGGRGGYSNSTVGAPKNPTTSGPNDVTWGGDSRSQIGGLGGHPISLDTNPRMFLGGGGGAGDHAGVIPPSLGGRGGNGGGIVWLVSQTISGNGSVIADGGNGGNSEPNSSGAGGGGGGGTVQIHAQSTQGIQVSAKGGNGGSHTGNTVEANGPGGGGSGGFIEVLGGTVGIDASRGMGGISQSSTMITSFPRNGATEGGLGFVKTMGSLLADLQVSVSSDVAQLPIPGHRFSFLVKVSNLGPDFVMGATVTGHLSTMYPDVQWNCIYEASQVAYANCVTKSGTGNLSSKVDLAPGAEILFKVEVTIPTYVYDDTVQYTANASLLGVLGINDVDSTNNQFVFTLEPPADLAMSVIADEKRLIGQNPLHIHVPIENLGPYCAHNLRLQMDFPIGTNVQSAVGEGWSCTKTLTQVICTMPLLDAAQKTQLDFVLIPPLGSTSYAINTKVTSQSFDPNEVNNQVSIEWLETSMERTLAGGGIVADGCSLSGQRAVSPRNLVMVLVFMILVWFGLYLQKRRAQDSLNEDEEAEEPQSLEFEVQRG